MNSSIRMIGTDWTPSAPLKLTLPGVPHAASWQETANWVCDDCYKRLAWAKERAERLDTEMSAGIPGTVVPEFRAWLREIGAKCGKTAEQVYALWREYCQHCQWADQSPVKSEFCDWYKDQLTTSA